jgi:hypothetical protein
MPWRHDRGSSFLNIFFFDSMDGVLGVLSICPALPAPHKRQRGTVHRIVSARCSGLHALGITCRLSFTGSQPLPLSGVVRPLFVSAFRKFWPLKAAVDYQTLSFSASFYKIHLVKNHSKST